VKPLPRTIIGRTCLSTYPAAGRRHFPITRTYSANLFGVELKVGKSLAFQEQDTVVAACATSALWSVFHGTGVLFQHAILSPSAITKIATEQITDGERSRAFPSHGLDAIEMARAIKEVGLEPYPVRVTNEYLLKGTAYAYLKAGIPMIFGFMLYDAAQTPSPPMGKHAVALTGFSLPDGPPKPFGPNFNLRASRIDKFYAHDDQVGPFARMAFDGISINVPNQPLPVPTVATSWRGSDEQIGSGRAVPEILLVPLYHKIRIPFGCIHDQVMEFDSVVDHVFRTIAGATSDAAREVAPAAPASHEWDIYLTTVNLLKADIARSALILPGEKAKLLTSRMPRYLWRATVLQNDTPFLDLIFDATDIEQGSNVIGVAPIRQIFYGNSSTLAPSLLWRTRSVPLERGKSSNGFATAPVTD